MNYNRASTPDDDQNQLQGFRHVQAEKNDLEIENQKLKEQLANALNQQPEDQRRCRRRRIQLPEIEEADLCSEVMNIANKFTYMSLLWLEQPDVTFEMELDDDYHPHDRFASADAWIEGQLRELLDAIPSKLHEHISNKRFINTFVHAMHQQRSNASTRVRPHCGAAIFRCTNEEYADCGNRFKELIGWTVPNNGQGSGYYEAFAPILFKDYGGHNDKWKIFRNPILMRKYAALLLGPLSVKNTKGDQIFIRDSSHCNIESLWSVRGLTPGAIAMAAILARFSASSDLAFRPTGVTTEIEYQEDYRTYLEYLSEGLRLKKPSVLTIFQHWNDVFYSNLSDSPQQAASKPPTHNRRAILADLYNEQEQDLDNEGGQNSDANEGQGDNNESGPDDDENDTDMRTAAVITDYTQSSEHPDGDLVGHLEHEQRHSSPLSDLPRPPLHSRHNIQQSSAAAATSKKRVVDSDLSDTQGEKENVPAKRRRSNVNKQISSREMRKVTRNSQKSSK